MNTSAALESELPNSLEAEKNMLGACMMWPDDLEAALGLVTVDDFSIEKHRIGRNNYR